MTLARAAFAEAQLNLSHTWILAPSAGRIGSAPATPNLADRPCLASPC